MFKYEKLIIHSNLKYIINNHLRKKSNINRFINDVISTKIIHLKKSTFKF